MHVPVRLVKLLLSVLDLLNADRAYLKVMFYSRLGYRLNINNPQSFNEKIQWIKLYDHNPKYTEYSDKYKVRDFIEATIGSQYLIPLLAVYKSADAIDFTSLPDQFVLKCNHGYGCNIICKDKSKLNIEETKAKLDFWLHKDFSKYKKEYHYKNIPPLILCEKYLEDKIHQELFDYKFFCIGEKVRMIQVDFDRFDSHTRNLYDVDWNLLDLEISFPRNSRIELRRPKQLEKMIQLAECLSKGFAEVRVDFYIIKDSIYFGEMTFTSGAGFSKYNPLEIDFKLGALVQINNIHQ